VVVPCSKLFDATFEVEVVEAKHNLLAAPELVVYRFSEPEEKVLDWVTDHERSFQSSTQSCSASVSHHQGEHYRQRNQKTTSTHSAESYASFGFVRREWE